MNQGCNARLVAVGLDGTNPLGFLAAVGLLGAAAGRWGPEEVRLGWQLTSAGWRPWLDGVPSSPGEIAHELAAQLAGRRNDPGFALADDLNVSPATFRSFAEQAVAAATPRDRSWADLCSAFGCDVLTDTTGETIQDTALRTMSGAGHQHLLKFMRNLIAAVDAHHLEKAIFASWRYDDPAENFTLRWDPADDQSYALRWRNPSGDPLRKRVGAMWGANRLAIEALLLLPCMPADRELRTTGFRRRGETGVTFTWPIWTAPVSVEVCRSLLTLPELQLDSPPRELLFRRGVVEVVRTRRLTRGKFRSFTPGQPV